MRAIPLTAARRGNAQRLFAAIGGGLRWVNAWEPLKDAVRSKALRYGELDKPLVVAVNSDQFHLNRIDEVQALYGEEEIVVAVGGLQERTSMRRRPNGV